MSESEKTKIIDANIAYHSALADTYDKDQPHFKQENQERVDAIIKALAQEAGNGSLVDFGCGTGFVINIAKKYFKRVAGVDITQKMLDLVDLTGGNIELFKTETSDTSLKSSEFNVCTAYGFLHHLQEPETTFKEAYRILRENGTFYADLDPNYYYWDMIRNIQDCSTDNQILSREIKSVIDKVDEISDRFHLDREVISLAEYQKIVKGGFKEEEIVALLLKAGFAHVDFNYEWYIGQAYYIHNEPETGEMIEAYLRKLLPATRHLFKYVSFKARK